MRKLLLFVLFFGLFFSGMAQKVELKEAQKFAQNFIESRIIEEKGSSALENVEMSLIETATKSSQVVYYVFDIKPKGFIIVSAEKTAFPVIGYSVENDFSTNMSSTMQWWLDGKAMEIVEARNMQADAEITDTWNKYLLSTSVNMEKSTKGSVAPIISARWNQNYPYNSQCPAHAGGPGGYCYAGCVATAMSQIIYHYEYPTQPYGICTYYHPHYGSLSIDLSTRTYDFSIMSPQITSVNMTEIATLMSDCGIAVDMNYTPTGSGAMSYNAAYAFRNNFNYAPRLEYLQRADYLPAVWEEMCKESLELGMPIYYAGTDYSVGGHAFVCDGYNSNNLFHFNWGWSGSGNGYFRLDNLNSGNGNFSSSQSAIFQLCPYDYLYCKGQKVMTASEKLFTDGSDHSYYWNNTSCQYLIQPDSGDIIQLNFTLLDLAANDYITIYDGATTSSPVIGTYTGSNLPPQILSSTSSLLIDFFADSVGNAQGFNAYYTVQDFASNNDIEYISDINVYPNPAIDNLNIDFRSIINTSTTIGIYDLSGRLVMDAVSEDIFTGQNSFNIDISDLSKGMYIVKIEGEKLLVTEKIFVSE